MTSVAAGAPVSAAVSAVAPTWPCLPSRLRGPASVREDRLAEAAVALLPPVGQRLFVQCGWRRGGLLLCLWTLRRRFMLLRRL